MAGKSCPAGSGSAVAISEISVSLEAPPGRCSSPRQRRSIWRKWTCAIRALHLAGEGSSSCDVGGAVQNEIGQRRDWPTCGRDQRRSRHPEPIPRDGSQTVTCRRDRPGAQPQERLEDVNLSSLDVLVSRDEQTSAFCLRPNWSYQGNRSGGSESAPSCDGKRARAGRPQASLMAGKSCPAGSGSAVAISEISVSLGEGSALCPLGSRLVGAPLARAGFVTKGS
ncbi:uncharacterized protein RBU57_010100 isoform 2-T2 [Macrochelys suwanniensis]